MQKNIKLLKKFEELYPIQLSILDNKICCIYDEYGHPRFLLFEKLSNEYKQIKDAGCINDDFAQYREIFKFKNWKIELDKYRSFVFLSINGRSFRPCYEGYFEKYQKLFIEPSFLILGEEETLIDLEKDEYIQPDTKIFNIHKLALKKKRKNGINLETSVMKI